MRSLFCDLYALNPSGPLVRLAPFIRNPGEVCVPEMRQTSLSFVFSFESAEPVVPLSHPDSSERGAADDLIPYV